MLVSTHIIIKIWVIVFNRDVIEVAKVTQGYSLLLDIY